VLLLKAVRSLPEREQDVVLAFLLERGRSGDEVLAWSPRPEVEPRRVVSPAMAGQWHLGSSPQGSLRTVPVRFPEPQYQRLKDWCENHGFPMAVVVRGLVERFLDEQENRAV
jgi:hypothetical protein